MHSILRLYQCFWSRLRVRYMYPESQKGIAYAGKYAQVRLAA